MKHAIVGLALAGIAATGGAAEQQLPLYRQANATVEARVADLLARMTLDEKVAQLQGVWTRMREVEDEQGRFDPTNARALLGLGIGEVSHPSEIARSIPGARVRHAREHAVFVNAVQKWLIENTRLGIPAMFHEEALHGLTAPGAHISRCRSASPALTATLDVVAR